MLKKGSKKYPKNSDFIADQWLVPKNGMISS